MMTQFDPTTRRALTRRNGFTLTELLVSVAILAGMMTLIATIFSTAGKATGTAQSLTKQHRQIQQVAESIKKDLESMTNGSGRVLAIAGVQVVAYDTPDDLASQRALQTPNDLHRADVMMLVTPRAMKPYIADAVDQDNLEPFKQVVYGHALIGQLTESGWTLQGLNQVPASRWHLARRVTGFLQSGILQAGVSDSSLLSGEFTNQAPMAGDLADVFSATFTSLTVSQGTPLGYYVYRNVSSGNPSLFSYYLYDPTITIPGPYAFNPMRLSSGGGYSWLTDDPNDALGSTPYWWQARSASSTGWQRDEGGTPIDFPVSPPPPAAPGQPDGPPLASTFQQSGGSVNWKSWPSWFYNGEGSRVAIDPDPEVPGAAKYLAPYFLPACSEFKVEVTFDDPRILPTFLDGNAFVVAASDLNRDENITDGDDAPAPDPINWQTVPNDEMWVWYDTPSSAYAASGDSRQYTDPFVWPSAVRITITAYDPAGNLDDPVTTSIIHAFE